jgi:hypothetical protein
MDGVGLKEGMVGFVGRYIEGGKVGLLVGTKASNRDLDPNLYHIRL